MLHNGKLAPPPFEPLPHSQLELLKMISLSGVCHVDNHISSKVLVPVKCGGKICRGIVTRSIRLPDNEGLRGKPRMLRMKNHLCPLAFSSYAIFHKLRAHPINLIPVETLTKNIVKSDTQTIVDFFELSIADLDDRFPNPHVLGVPILKPHQLRASKLQSGRILLSQCAPFAIQILKHSDRVTLNRT
ncbi:MAG: hypothetical protein BWY82_00615 [Verrucomicrobia bacterium ADurb.Bin474]|nr:MAG: hypothetical protein BWY82_00615 [Verrucomicrobia bacterium ADurb.Bin474]